MLKKALMAGGGLVLLSGLMFGTDAWSYVTTGVSSVRQTVRESVPIGVEIERARNMAKELGPAINDNKVEIARAEVELARLDRQIATFEEKLDQDRLELLVRKEQVVKGKTVSYRGRTASESELKADLAQRFERFKTNEATLTSMKKLHATRENTIEAARRKLEGMLASKRQLEVEIENLTAQHEIVSAAEAANQYNFDDSQLGRLKELVADVQVRLETRQKMADLETDAYLEIPVTDETSSENIVDQVTSYFDEPATVAASK